MKSALWNTKQAQQRMIASVCSWLGLLTIAFLFGSASTMLANTGDSFPPFIAEGNVLTETFGFGNPSAMTQIKGKFSFVYSNGIWQIQIAFQAENGLQGGVSDSMVKTVLDCKRIPDGIRMFATQNTNLYDFPLPPSKETVATLAQAKPITFPPPDCNELFLCWLSLCPDPELPLIDAIHTHRLISADLLTNEQNIGTYSLSYLERQSGFLERLVITNNGILFPAYGGTKQLSPPWNNGYLEFEYQVLNATNIDGVSFPTQTVLRKYVIGVDSDKRESVYAVLVTHASIERITVGESKKFSIPAAMIAEDRRPTNLPLVPGLHYAISNDTWLSVTNPKVVAYADSIRINEKIFPNELQRKRNIVKVALILVVLGVPALLFFSQRRLGKHK